MFEKLFGSKKEAPHERPEPTFSEAELDRIKLKLNWHDLAEGNDRNLAFGNAKVIEGLVDLVWAIEKETDLASYDTIFSDDASGRLISLFMRELVNAKREKKGKESVETYFLATGRHDQKKIRNAVQDFVREKKEGVDRALLVTEFINTGRSIEKISSVLSEEGIDFDIASAETKNGIDMSDDTRKRLFSGDVPFTAFYHKPELTGVIKGDTANVDEDMMAHPRKSMVLDEEKMKRVREDLRRTAGRLSDALYGEESKEE